MNAGSFVETSQAALVVLAVLGVVRLDVPPVLLGQLLDRLLDSPDKNDTSTHRPGIDYNKTSSSVPDNLASTIVETWTTYS